MAFPCNLNSALLKNGLALSPPFVSRVLRDQAMGSAMHNAPALQEEREGGYEQCKWACRVNSTPNRSLLWNKCVRVDSAHNTLYDQNIISFQMSMMLGTIEKQEQKGNAVIETY